MGPPIEAPIENFRRLEERIRTARRHLEFGNTMIEYYKRLLEKYRAESRDTAPVEHVLEAFERSPLNKIRVPSRTKNSPSYRNGAKAAFKRALDKQYGSLGPASSVRRIDPKTGLTIDDADDIRKSLGPEVADRL